MKRRHPLWTALGVLALLIALNTAAAVLYDLRALLPWLLLAGAGALLYRRRRRIPQAPRRVLPGRAEQVSEAEDLRRQVAKLEDDASRNEQLIEDLEDAAGRRIEAITATYRHLQEKYGPAAVGKPGRRP